MFWMFQEVVEEVCAVEEAVASEAAVKTESEAPTQDKKGVRRNTVNV